MAAAAKQNRRQRQQEVAEIVNPLGALSRLVSYVIQSRTAVLEAEEEALDAGLQAKVNLYHTARHTFINKAMAALNKQASKTGGEKVGEHNFSRALYASPTEWGEVWRMYDPMNRATLRNEMIARYGANDIIMTTNAQDVCSDMNEVWWYVWLAARVIDLKNECLQNKINKRVILSALRAAIYILEK